MSIIHCSVYSVLLDIVESIKIDILISNNDKKNNKPLRDLNLLLKLPKDSHCQFSDLSSYISLVSS